MKYEDGLEAIKANRNGRIYNVVIEYDGDTVGVESTFDDRDEAIAQAEKVWGAYGEWERTHYSVRVDSHDVNDALELSRLTVEKTFCK